MFDLTNHGLLYWFMAIQARRGTRWFAIHAAGKVPDEATIKAMENFTGKIYGSYGIRILNFQNIIRFQDFRLLINALRF
ncbi:hypothetical protein DVH24_005502 [Malus domestica]|uniref:Uncharacterized protein n=1 Tax=Malus domestica TaxID=3750 RepID=A0A498KN41_MALDO|nr:hypothetical protein DVH24_005502 [Malus domestica]